MNNGDEAISMNLIENEWKSAWSDMRRTKKETWYEEWLLPCIDDKDELHYLTLLIIYSDPHCQKMHLYVLSNRESILSSYYVIGQILEDFCSSSNYEELQYNPVAERSYTFQTILLDCSDDDLDEACEKKVECLIYGYDHNSTVTETES